MTNYAQAMKGRRYDLYECCAGWGIGAFCEFMVEEATWHNRRIYGVFNGALFYADPGDKPEVVGERWDKEFRK